MSNKKQPERSNVLSLLTSTTTESRTEKGQKEAIPETVQEQLPETQHATIPEKTEASKPDKTKYAKAGYRVSPESANQMEEMRLDLRRTLGRKVYFEEMLEVMIDHAYKDLQAFQQDSFLVRQLKNKTEK